MKFPRRFFPLLVLCGIALPLSAAEPADSGTEKQAIERRAHAEHALLMDAMAIAQSCQQFMLEQNKDSAAFSVDPRTGEVTGDIVVYVKRITVGTVAMQKSLQRDGKLVLRNPEAFGGADITFNAFGQRTK
jgi:hypothetical protein